MTHPNFVTNGASLEDCHTNFFALAELCGLKWRRYISNSVMCFNPVDDPVLSSFSKCLAADILCVWRRVALPVHELHRHNLQDCNQLNYKKELWIFWYGKEEPDLTGMISPELTADAVQGPWDSSGSGLSYECRTLLFKALHNLIERSLLQKGFSRLGRWFVQAADGWDHDARSSQLTFSFNFFVHGDINVCASIDVRQRPPIRRLAERHLAMAQGNQAGLKVILSPFGLAGTLTGQSYKGTDLVTQRLLNDWHQFYPLRSMYSKDYQQEDNVPPAVEVIVSGVKMRYPSSYVLVLEAEEAAAARDATMSYPEGFSSQQKFPANTLTPPTSPFEPSIQHGLHLSYKYMNQTASGCGTLSDSTISEPSAQTLWRIRQGAWQDSGLQLPSSQACSTESNSGEQSRGHWDFCDPSSLSDCKCSRCKESSKTNLSVPKSVETSISTVNSTPVTPTTTSSTVSSSTVNSTTVTSTGVAVPPPPPPPPRKSDKLEKTKVPHKFKGSTPFHKRNLYTDSLVEIENFTQQAFNVSAPSGTPMLNSTCAVNFQFKGLNPSLRAATPIGLPQLHTSIAQPSSLGSPLLSTPSNDAVGSQLSSTEPAMPTLSPHLPKEEEIEPQLESQEPAAVTQSPATAPDASSETAMKEKPTTEPLPSPFQNNIPSVPENIKSEESPASQSCAWSVGQQEDVKPPLSAESTTQSAVAASQAATVAASSAPPGLKRPALDVCTHEDPHDELVMEGLLYDYSFLNTSVWESLPGKKRPRVEDSMDSSDGLDDSYMMDYDLQSSLMCDDPLSLKPKDPYEYDEFDEESPSAGFRIKPEICIKEEEKMKEPGLPPTPESQGPPMQISVGPLTPIQDSVKPMTADDQQSISSPLSPRNQISSFTSENDLRVTEKDLENIFEALPSDDSADDLFQTPSTPTSTKIGTPEEPFQMKCKSNSGCSSGIIGVADLIRMFPTPPSLDNNTASSPSGPLCGSDILSGENECPDGYVDGSSSPCHELDGVVDVYKLPVQQKFIGSQRYAPLSSLPNSAYPSLGPEYVYKPSWMKGAQVAAPVSCPMNLPTNANQFGVHVDRHLPGSSSQYPLMSGNENERGVPSVFSVDHPGPDQRNLSIPSYELQSPASSASSYLNKHLNSIDSSSATLPVPEAHSLLVNIEISDSMLNIFKDHNFASCMLCVCNMNTKGTDAGIYLPNSLIPSGADEPQYKCTCGFSAVSNRHVSHRSGLFYEDELDVTGHHYETFCHKKSLLAIEGNPKKLLALEGTMGFDDLAAQVDHVPHSIIDLVKVQCSQLYSSFSLFHKSENLRRFNKLMFHYNALEVADGCEVCFMALDAGKQAVDNVNNNRLDESLKSSCLHKWPYLSAKVPASNLEVIRLLRSLEPILQEAIRQRRHLWEATNPVKGPLTWRQFHRLAGRGTEDQCEPQPIPSLLVGYDKDWVALSPFALKFWDKLLLEPYTQNRDVAYVVVAPDSEFVLGHVKTFFKELSTIYELCRLGRHCPITKVLRDGIMRVGKSTAKNLADEPIDEWFNLIGDGPIATRLKLYAQACRYHLAPHLATQSLDSSLLDPPVMLKLPEKPAPVASPKPPSSFSDGQSEKDQFSTNRTSETGENQADSSASAGTEGAASSSSTQESCDIDDNQQAPTVVMYVVEPFTYGSADVDVYRLATLGLLRSYSLMLQHLPEHIRNAIQLQVIALDSIMTLGRTDDGEKRQNQLKDLAFSVFSRCHQLLSHQSTAKSLTGFGPAAAQDLFLKSKDARNSMYSALTSKPFALAPQKDKQTELGEMFGDRREKSGILYCTYCLTEDQRWLVACCTNEKGDILETCSISTEIPNRTRRKKASVRKFSLHKLLDFIVEVMSKSILTWRLVVGRLGRLGHFELRDWATLLSRKSLLRYSRQLRQLCQQCSVLNPPDSPGILSACLVSLEPDTSLRVMVDQYTPTTNSNSSSSCNTCFLSTPQDASVTHILVFPTSATAQSSQLSFQQEHIDPLAGTLGDDDIFQALNDDDITVGQDINDIFRWTESPSHSPGASPRRDSLSQPGSPGCVMGERNSPFHHGVPGRGSGNLVMMDTVEEPLQLLQQPLALGYYISTAKTGALPKWFWATCPHLQNICPVYLKSALLINSSLQQNPDDLLHSNPQRNCHPLDSSLTTDVLRYVLEGYNTLSWLSLDPTTHDRRSCLPVHVQVLMQLYHAVEALI